MGSANERWHYIVMSSLIGWAHTQNDPWRDRYMAALAAQKMSRGKYIKWLPQVLPLVEPFIVLIQVSLTSSKDTRLHLHIQIQAVYCMLNPEHILPLVAENSNSSCLLHTEVLQCFIMYVYLIVEHRGKAKSRPTRLTHWFLGDLKKFESLFQWLMAEVPLVKLPSDEYHGTLLMISQYWIR